MMETRCLRQEPRSEDDPLSILLKKDAANNLSNLATGILLCCIRPPIDIEEEASKMSHKRITLRIISNYLHKSCGWPYSEIREGIAELREFIREDM